VTHTWLRKAISSTFVGFCALSVLVALVPLALLLFFVVVQGIQALNFDFFTKMPKPVGETGGGLANAIVGTLILTGLGSLFAIPIGILSGVYMSEYAGTRFASLARFAADTLNGVPSIVIGVFVYGIAVLPFKQFSAIAGGLALGVMMIPIIARTTEELLLLVPGTMREGALALGATRYLEPLLFGICGLGFLNHRRMREDAMRAIADVDLHVRSADALLSELSGGQRQGVAIARAMHFKSRVLILDEPTNHLSVRETAKVLGFVRSLPAQGVTGILISHNLHHVFQSCDRVVAMARGEIVFDKPVVETNLDEVSDAL